MYSKKLIVEMYLLLLCFSAALAQESPHGNLNVQCFDCHTTTSFSQVRSDLRFDHNAQTKFQLMGQHKIVTCQSCHQSLVFSDLKGKAQQCLSCHQDQHRGEVGKQCERCHTSKSWVVTDMPEKHQVSRFPLLGVHRSVNCKQCHTNTEKNEFVGLPLDCSGCHRSDFLETKKPNHVAVGIGLTCDECHQVTSQNWKASTFQHPVLLFMKQGAHINLNCERCHNKKTVGTPADCFGCHKTDFQRVEVPNHSTGQFSTQCETCHNATSWTPALFNHSVTQFQLTGAHTTAQCQHCHTNGNYTNIPTDCWSCHETDFAQTTNPNHITAQFSHQCDNCHSSQAWNPSNFNHANTSFPLTGSHIPVQCQQCHVNGNYTNIPTDCWSCHETDFAQTTNPNHVVAQFSHQCETCHQTIGWQPATFDHAATQFPLTGAHTTAPCQQCHVNGNYTNIPTDCWSCHETDFAQTTNPNHVVAQFSHQCETCHNSTAFQPSTFNHTNTTFPLTGAHVATPCQQCHVNGNYTSVPTDCWNCHETDYTSANDPPHTLPGFPHNCTQCHTTQTWEGASFNHNTTSFPLTGAHATAQCQQCHVNGNYTSVPTECYPCHTTDFTSAPQHSSKGYPHNCTTSQCHNTSNWNSSFNHTPEFPIGNGTKHRPGRWNLCGDCHPNANSFSVFTCTTSCHPQAQMNNKHNGVSGYSYNSSACYSCHPDGDEKMQWR
jgi:hypothetical protein